MLTRLASRLRPTRVDYYVLSEVTGALIGSCVFIVFFLLMAQILRIGEFLISHGVSGAIFLKMCGLMILTFLPLAIPLAFLIGLLISFTRFSTDSELIAFKASGFSLTRLAAPLLVLAGLICILQTELNQQWVPWSVTAYKTLEERVRNTKVTSIIKEGAFTSGFFDMLIFAETVDQKTNTLKRVFIYDEREPRNPLTYVAREAEIVPMKTRSQLGSAVIFKLFNGSMHHSSLEQKTYEKIDFDEYQLYLKIKESSDQAGGSPQMIPQEELLTIIEKFPKGSPERTEFLGEYWRRNSLAVSPFIFLLLGMGLGTFRQRSNRLNGILIGLLVAISYWTLQVWGTSAMTKGTVSPFLGMHSANLILLPLGLLSFRRSSW